MDVPKATHVVVQLYWADVEPLLTAVIGMLSQPGAPQPERIALLSVACQLNIRKHLVQGGTHRIIRDTMNCAPITLGHCLLGSHCHCSPRRARRAGTCSYGTGPTKPTSYVHAAPATGASGCPRRWVCADVMTW
jgi:hypothetical protein